MRAARSRALSHPRRGTQGDPRVHRRVVQLASSPFFADLSFADGVRTAGGCRHRRRSYRRLFMPRRKVSGAATHQEAPGATSAAPDKATYVRQHATFRPSRPPASRSATRTEQLPTRWTGASPLAPSATEVTACSLAVHHVDSSFSQDRPAQYAPAKRTDVKSKPKPRRRIPAPPRLVLQSSTVHESGTASLPPLPRGDQRGVAARVPAVASAACRAARWSAAP